MAPLAEPATDPDDEYTSAGRLPEPAPRLFDPDDEPQRCKSICWALTLLLIVIPLVIVGVLAVVPFLLFTLFGLCCGRAPPPLSKTEGEPRRPAARTGGTSTIQLRDGRQLEYICCGPEDGTPAVFVHGYGCSGLMFASPYFDAIFAAHKIRCVVLQLWILH